LSLSRLQLVSAGWFGNPVAQEVARGPTSCNPDAAWLPFLSSIRRNCRVSRPWLRPASLPSPVKTMGGGGQKTIGFICCVQGLNEEIVDLCDRVPRGNESERVTVTAVVPVVRRTIAAVCVTSALLWAGGQGANAQSAAEVCLAANQTLSIGIPLPRAAARLKAGALRVVALGSSSTTGLWVLGSGSTYPEVMRRELAALRPGAQIDVINSGRIGDTISGTLARLQSDVFAHRPDLVIWQLGTNDVAWGGRADGARDWILAGVRALKSDGADVILMDLQYAPMVLATSQHEVMQATIAEVAREERVGLFSRFSLMRRSVEAGLPAGALVAWDGLHNSAAGYDCLGRALARAIHAAAR
jgi:acyl-CoA thioesterase I